MLESLPESSSLLMAGFVALANIKGCWLLKENSE